MSLSFTSQIWNPKATNKRKSPHLLVPQKNTKILTLMNIVLFEFWGKSAWRTVTLQMAIQKTPQQQTNSLMPSCKPKLSHSPNP